MKININKPTEEQIIEKDRVIRTGQTIIAPNLIKESVIIDRNGNVIDRKTGQIIKDNE